MAPSLSRGPFARLAWIAAATAAGFFLLGYGAILLKPEGSPAAIIWPANAFALCMILRYARGWPAYAFMLACTLAGDLLGNALSGAPALTTIGYSLVNTLEIGLALAFAGHKRIMRFSGAWAAIRFGLKVGLLPTVMGAAVTALVIQASGLPDAITAGRNWLFADLLGFCIIFPIGMTLSWRQIKKLRIPERMPLAAGVVVLLVCVTLLVYPLRNYSLQFLILPAALIATAQFRMLGASTAMIIIGGIILADPLPPKAFDPIMRIQYLQLFLAVCSLVCVRAASVLDQRDLAMAIIERNHRRAVRASRFKSQLLAHVSHEVRSPLSAIIGFSSMLESGSLSAERAPEFAAIIAHNGELLQRLHDDLLDMSRAEAGALTMQPERVAVGDTLKNCVSAIRLDATLGGKDVLVESVADSLALQCDPVRLAQILNNLIANAFKYGDNSSPIRVSAHAMEDGFGRIEIANSGPGIPKDEREAVFMPFRRSTQVGRKVPGAGLGLSIAKMLVEAQGGRIDFDSVPGRQTRFWIDLPLAA